MNSIFKVKHGTYVDLSRIKAIDFSTNVGMNGVDSTVSIYYEMDERDKLFKNNANDLIVLRLCEYKSKYDNDLRECFIDEKINERSYSNFDYKKACQIVKEQIIDGHKHLIDAWKEYKEWHSKYTE